MTLITGPELAETLGYTRARIWQLTRDGLIPSVKIGNRHHYKARVVARLKKNGLPGNPRPERRIAKKKIR